MQRLRDDLLKRKQRASRQSPLAKRHNMRKAGTSERIHAARSMQALGMQSNIIEMVSTRGKPPATVMKAQQESARGPQFVEDRVRPGSQRRHYSASPDASRRAVVQGGSPTSPERSKSNVLVHDIKVQASFAGLTKEPRRGIANSQSPRRGMSRDTSMEDFPGVPARVRVPAGPPAAPRPLGGRAAWSEDVRQAPGSGWLQKEVDKKLRNIVAQHLDIDVNSSEWANRPFHEVAAQRHVAVQKKGVARSVAAPSGGVIRRPPTRARSTEAPRGGSAAAPATIQKGKTPPHISHQASSLYRRRSPPPPAQTTRRSNGMPNQPSIEFQQSVSVVKTLQNMTERTPADTASNAVLTNLVQEKLDRIWEAVVNELDGKKSTGFHAGEGLSVISTEADSAGLSPGMTSLQSCYESSPLSPARLGLDRDSTAMYGGGLTERGYASSSSATATPEERPWYA
eukprot:CAMPEP_0178377156 /NCGR_PEP_ID=MMETSP0689_2-20121128/3774_1 /TAXON_ID=160604 /ORGANISM="Amphidinium massartii, Strain CS-259" /LENGTH=453 /DNA_ID=CAMNT_0019997203 /DNA_START=120 /DNA_END=1482 /DNA_ORIENTATION=-